MLFLHENVDSKPMKLFSVKAHTMQYSCVTLQLQLMTQNDYGSKVMKLRSVKSRHLL